jgi:hypothetical protein
VRARYADRSTGHAHRVPWDYGTAYEIPSICLIGTSHSNL